MAQQQDLKIIVKNPWGDVSIWPSAFDKFNGKAVIDEVVSYWGNFLPRYGYPYYLSPDGHQRVVVTEMTPGNTVLSWFGDSKQLFLHIDNIQN